MQTAGDFLVYSCPSCGKRIFTQKRFQGRHGSCPLCGDSHLVGGAPEVLLTEDEPSGVTTAEEAPDRRGAKRVRPRHSQGVEVRPARRPPDYSVGDAIALTLHSSKINVRPRSFRAIVRRIEATKKRGSWRVGAEFMGLVPEDIAFLRELLA